ncbi:MAG: hypothetical protein ACOX7F_01935 [Eubacteriales bacterium]|jgi:hypothetical protein
MTSAAIPTLFLGTNAPGTFVSHFEQLLNPQSLRKLYILKGGPGCGKSTLMRHVGESFAQAGHPIVHIPCSSDPHSLDVIVVPDLGIAVVDGTAPHVLEPLNPGLDQTIWNLGQFIDEEGMRSVEDQVRESQHRLSQWFQRSWRYLLACQCLLRERDSLLTPYMQSARLQRLASRLIKKEFPQRRGITGRLSRGFLTAITPEGVVTTQQWLREYRCYWLKDSHGLVHQLLKPLQDAALERGWNVLACYDPLEPQKLRQLIVPQCRLAFLCDEPPCAPQRVLNLDRYVDPHGLALTRGRRRFLRKTFDALLEGALDSLREAKAEHDVLEVLYTTHVDFDALNVWQNALLQKLLRDSR